MARSQILPFFSDVQCRVPPTDIRVCAGFYQKRQLETDWGTILLPRGTALLDGFEFDILSKRSADTVSPSIYGGGWL